VHERDSLRAGPAWSRTCIFCHNTVPEVDRLLGAIAGPGAGPYQGAQVDRWLSVDRRATMRVVDVGDFARVVSAELARLGGGVVTIRDRDGPAAYRAGAGGRDTARRAIDVVRAGFEGDDLLEVGIGCEACHGGAREHARQPSVKPSLVPRAP